MFSDSREYIRIGNTETFPSKLRTERGVQQYGRFAFELRDDNAASGALLDHALRRVQPRNVV